MSALDLDAVRKRLRAVVRQRRAQAALLEADGKPEGAAVDYVLALITRLRAAEARTAWQPIETAPRADDDAPPWVLGLYVGGHVYAVMPLRSGGWMDMDGNRRHAPIAWAPLPAAPETPHV